VNEVQRFVDGLTSLSWFLPKLVEKMKSTIQLVKKTSIWRNILKNQELIIIPTNNPKIVPDTTHHCVLIYLSIRSQCGTRQDINKEQSLIYFISRTLQKAKTRYQMVEKVALMLVITTLRMKPYFQNHQVIIKSNYLINKVLSKL